MIITLTFSLLFLYQPEGDQGDTYHGFIETDFTDRRGKVHKYLVFLPYDFAPGQSRPLLLFLNGLMENGNDGYRSIGNNFGVQIWEMKRRFPFVCAIPQCAEGESWDGEQLDTALEFADAVARRYDTDPARFCVTGVSQGGQGVWKAIAKYPERFAAAVPMCGSPQISDKQLSTIDVPIWNFYNESDEDNLVQANREVRRKLLESGASPIFTEYNQTGHNCWDWGYRSMGLYEWLFEQRRTVGKAKGAGFRLLPAHAVIAKWRSHNVDSWAVSENGALQFNRSASSQSSAILACDESHHHFEFHLDAFIPDSGTLCRLAMVDADSNLQQPTGYEIVLPLRHAGIGGVQTLNAQRVGDLAPVAQQQLRAGYDNDIRMTYQSQHLRIYVNGWLAVDIKLPDIGTGRFSPALVGDEGVLWRNIRTRYLR